MLDGTCQGRKEAKLIDREHRDECCVIPGSMFDMEGLFTANVDGPNKNRLDD